MRGDRVLGVSIGTRKVGIAIVEPQCVVDYALKSFRGTWSPDKRATIVAILERYARRYQVTRLALKIPPTYTHSSAITELIQEINMFACRGSIQISTYSLKQLKEKGDVPDGSNKWSLFERLLISYQLLQLARRGEKDEWIYYRKVFEAIAVADVTTSD